MQTCRAIVSSLFIAFGPAASVAAEIGTEARDWQQTALQIAYERHLDDVPPQCDSESGSETARAQAVGHLLRIGEESAARDALLVEFICRSQAQEQSSVYILVDENGVASPIFFPVPQLEIRYKAEGGDEVQAIVITERVDNREVINARYDPASRTMEEFDTWNERGMTDTRTRWGFRHGRFEIMSFATDDGQHDPQIVIERDIW